ncbi:MAG TPA: nitric-oxide reductase large subunit, partial [Thermaerobacter sp.]
MARVAALSYRNLWIALTVVLAGSFAVLGYFGREIYVTAPPLPERVAVRDGEGPGEALFTGEDIRQGQNVWQSMGGQELGSVWGHGAYVAPDWTADWLHREAVWLLEHWARAEYGRPYDRLAPEEQAVLRTRLAREIRTNTYDPRSGRIVVSPLRARAIQAVAAHYQGLFGDAPELAGLREAYAMPANAVPDPERRRKLAAFFFWTAWAAGTNRPGQDVTYTSNWPPEPLVGNEPTPHMIVWSVVSFVLLLAGIGALAWYFAAERYRAGEHAPGAPERDPLLDVKPTPSMEATRKYFWLVAILWVVQILMGVLTAHYAVEGTGFYGFPLARWLPYAITRTWHVQLAILWIATAWLATGLFLAPAVSGREPRGQRLGVNLLFVALLVIVAGALAGQWLGVIQRLGLDMNFWFGHQGYEYVDLGRAWQIALFAGLFLWLFLMGRALWPALKKGGEERHLLGLFLLSSLAIAAFYGAGLMYGSQTNLAIAEYWRWWVVHLWVEGFFEVFATVVVAFLFTRMGLLRPRVATASVLFSTIVFLTGGIIGIFHHLYFTGTSLAVLALGATFSALEVVPLVLIGFEAEEKHEAARRPPLAGGLPLAHLCLRAVAFWNLAGAGLFGFFIN